MFRFCIASAVLWLMACSSSRPVVDDPARTQEVLITFVTKAQAGYWQEAMENLTYEEKEAMMKEGELAPEYYASINRLRLSAVTRMPFSLDGKGRLVGMKAMLDASNLRYTVSDQQRGVNLSEVEKARAERIVRMRAEGERIIEEQANEVQPDEEVITNSGASSSSSEKYNPDDWQEGSSAPGQDDGGGQP